MRRPKFRLSLCAAGLAAALAGGALALGNGDSLISLSYLTDTFLPSAQSQLEEIQNDAMQEAYDQAAAQIQSGAGTGSLPCAHSTVPPPSSTGDETTSSIPSNSRATAQPTMSMIESTAPTS